MGHIWQDFNAGDVVVEKATGKKYVIVDARTVECQAHNDIWTDKTIKIARMLDNGTLGALTMLRTIIASGYWREYEVVGRVSFTTTYTLN